MVNEVNKIIRNTLISRGALTLPSVGTLRIVRKSAQIVGKGVSTPEYTITLSSTEDAPSLVDAIAGVANIPFADAEDIYLRWLDKSRSEGRVVIDGVGVICDKSLKAEEGIISQLNPFRGDTLTITRRRSSKSWIIYVTASLVVLLAVSAAYLFIGGNTTKDSDNSGVAHTEEESSAAPTIATTTPSIDTLTNTANTTTEIADNSIITTSVDDINGGVIEEVILAEQEEAEPITVGPWYEAPDIKHYVIVGSYKRRSNANGAIADIEAMADVDIACQAIKRGNMYSVAIFGSYDITSCERFVSQHKELFPQAWIYSVEAE